MKNFYSNSQKPDPKPILEDLVLIFGLLLKSLEVRAMIYDEISPNIHNLYSEYLCGEHSQICTV